MTLEKIINSVKSIKKNTIKTVAKFGLAAFLSAATIIPIGCQNPVTPDTPTPEDPVPKELTIYPTDDAYVSEDYPNENYGDSIYLKVASSNENRYYDTGKRLSFLKFSRMDLANIPQNAEIISADLRILDQNEISLGDVEVSLGVVLKDWQEETITWNNKPEKRPYFEDDDIVYHYGGRNRWDVTRIVKSWYDRASFDYGVYLAVTDNLNSDGRAFLFSKEFMSGKHSPYITIEYKE